MNYKTPQELVEIMEGRIANLRAESIERMVNKGVPESLARTMVESIITAYDKAAEEFLDNMFGTQPKEKDDE